MLLQAFRRFNQLFIPAPATGRHITPSPSPRAVTFKQARWGLLFALLLAVACLLFAPQSVLANDPPAKPTNLTAVPGDQEATLSWDDPGDSSIIRYEYLQTTDTAPLNVNRANGQSGGGSQVLIWTPIPGSSATTTSYTVSPLANQLTGSPANPDVLYTFQLRAVNLAEDGVTKQPGPASESVTTNPGLALDMPTGLAALWDPEAGVISLHWNEHPHSVETEFEVEWTNLSEGGDPETALVQSTSAAATGTKVRPGVAYGDYDFRIRARYNLGPWSEWTSVVRIKTTPFPEGLSTTREVDENAAVDDNVGKPVEAEVPSGFTATYSLDVQDANNDFFAIESSTGQITVKDDSLTSGQHTVTVTAAIAETTPSNPPQTATASIEVTINVTSSGRWSQVAKLASPNRAIGDSFGSAVAVAGTAAGTIVVGAKGVNIGSTVDAGAVYVFDGLEDNSPAKLTAPSTIAGEEVGYSVAIDGDTIVVGTSPASATAAGKVYVFVKPTTGGWVDSHAPAASLTVNGVTADGGFGEAVAISGDTIAVGAAKETYTDSQSNTVDNAGAAYVFTKPDAVWANGVTAAKLRAASPAEGDLFGSSVDADGDNVAVGAPGANKVFLFTKPNNGGWTDDQTPSAALAPSNAEDGDEFGASVDLDGNTLVVGATQYDSTANVVQTNPGRAYVFTKSQSSWEEGDDVLTGLGADPGDRFGAGMSASNGYVAVSRGNQADNDYAGSVQVFPSGWTTSTAPYVLTASDGADDDNFGASVAWGGFDLIVGAPGVSRGSGAVYVWTTAPAAPAGLTASPGDSQVALSWNDPADSTITKYQYRRTVTGPAHKEIDFSGAEWTEIDNSGPNTTSHTITRLENGRNAVDIDVVYAFQVRAVNIAPDDSTEQFGPKSNGVKASPGFAVDMPTDLTVDYNPGTRKITVTWDGSPFSGPTEFEVSWRDVTNDEEEQYSLVAFITNSGQNPEFVPATTASIDVGASYGEYEVKVRARFNAGPWSGWTEPVSLTAGPFVEGTSVTREVDENAAVGSDVGKPVAATVPSGFTPTYSMTDSDDYSIVPETGQIQVKGSDLAWGQQEVTVTVSVQEDGVDADPTTATIDVTINITSMGPWVEVAKISASNGAANDSLGTSVAVDETAGTIVVGAKGVGSNSGTVYVFDGPDGTGVKLTASSTGAVNEEFGYSVAIDGDTIVVGTSPASAAGKVYVFVEPANGWAASNAPAATLTATGVAAGDGFGESVAVSGDTIVVGAQTQDYTDDQSNTVTDSGAVYVFTKPTSGWNAWSNTDQVVELRAPTPAEGDLFGSSVDADGTNVAVGSTGAEEVYVFTKPSGGWVDSSSPEATLTPTNGQDGDNFGWSLMLDGSTLAVGAPQRDESGAAYVFTKSRTSWTEAVVLTGVGADAGDRFGDSVALSGNYLAVSRGAQTDNDHAGSVQVFQKPNTGWGSSIVPHVLLDSENGAANDYYGSSVSLNGNTLVVGASGFSGSKGAAYVLLAIRSSSTEWFGLINGETGTTMSPLDGDTTDDDPTPDVTVEIPGGAVSQNFIIKIDSVADDECGAPSSAVTLRLCVEVDLLETDGITPLPEATVPDDKDAATLTIELDATAWSALEDTYEKGDLRLWKRSGSNPWGEVSKCPEVAEDPPAECYTITPDEVDGGAKVTIKNIRRFSQYTVTTPTTTTPTSSGSLKNVQPQQQTQQEYRPRRRRSGGGGGGGGGGGYAPPAAENNPPNAVGAIPAQTLELGGGTASVNASFNFLDPEGAKLTYTAASSDESVVTVTVTGDRVVLNPVGVGQAVVTVTATDPVGGEATQDISATVREANTPPVVVSPVLHQSIRIDGGAAALDVGSNFSDRDPLSYTASSSDQGVVTVTVTGSVLTMTPVSVGTATLTITVEDDNGAAVSVTITVTMKNPNQPPVTVSEIQPQTLVEGDDQTTIDVAGNFSDEDDLTFSAASSNTSAVTVSMSGSNITISPVDTGTATIVVVASDPDGETATQIFRVTVGESTEASPEPTPTAEPTSVPPTPASTAPPPMTAPTSVPSTPAPTAAPLTPAPTPELTPVPVVMLNATPPAAALLVRPTAAPERIPPFAVMEPPSTTPR